MSNQPVVYTNRSGQTRTVRSNEDRIKAVYDGFKPPKEPAAGKTPKAPAGS